MQAGVWLAEQCETSLKTTALYEASGLALWLQTGTFTPAQTWHLEQGDVNWGSLIHFKNSWFSKKATFKANVTRAQGQKKVKVDKARLVWPTVMVCAVSKLSDASNQSFEGTLPLLASGQFILWAWYVALFEAIQAADAEPELDQRFLLKIVFL